MERQALADFCEREDLIGSRMLVTEILVTTTALVKDVFLRGDELHITTSNARRKIRPGPWEDDPDFSVMVHRDICFMREEHGIVSITFFDTGAKIFTGESGNMPVQSA